MTDALLALHFIGLMLGAGGGFGSMISARVAAAQPPEHAPAFRALGPALARLSTVGLIVMLATGVALVLAKYGDVSALPGLFWVKMLFVTTLTLAAIVLELTYAEVKRGNAAAAARIARIGPIAGASSLLAVVIAAFVFH